jgi:hypothetical protein
MRELLGTCEYIVYRRLMWHIQTVPKTHFYNKILTSKNFCKPLRDPYPVWSILILRYPCVKHRNMASLVFAWWSGPMSGPLFISMWNNLILYLAYLLRMKPLPKSEHSLSFSWTPQSKNLLVTNSIYLSDYLQAR